MASRSIFYSSWMEMNRSDSFDSECRQEKESAWRYWMELVTAAIHWRRSVIGARPTGRWSSLIGLEDVGIWTRIAIKGRPKKNDVVDWKRL